MGYSKLGPEKVQAIIDAEDKLKVLLDTNILIAYLDKEHEFNFEAEALFAPLRNRECYFIFHYIVLGEFINTWVNKKKTSVKEAILEIENLNESLQFSFTGGTSMSASNIFASFKKHSRHKKFIKAHFNDFMILVEAETIKNLKILTCDKKMYEAGRSIFKKNIYYLPFDSKKKSDLPRFMQDVKGFKKAHERAA